MENNDKITDSYVKIFNASQFVMLETIREITLLHTSLASNNITECKAQIEQINKHLSVLNKMIDNLQDYDDFGDEEPEDGEENYEEENEDLHEDVDFKEIEEKIPENTLEKDSDKKDG